MVLLADIIVSSLPCRAAVSPVDQMADACLHAPEHNGQVEAAESRGMEQSRMVSQGLAYPSPPLGYAKLQARSAQQLRYADAE